jgi:hypothetical protein
MAWVLRVAIDWKRMPGVLAQGVREGQTGLRMAETRGKRGWQSSNFPT